jgi:hypothetical protein
MLNRRTRFTLIGVCAALAVAGISYYFIKAPETAPIKRLIVHKATPTSFTWEAELSLFTQHFTLSEAPGKNTDFSDPFGIAIDNDNNIYVTDAGEHNRIIQFNVAGESKIIAGGEEGFADSQPDVNGKHGGAKFNTPSAIAIDAAGNLIVADTANNAIRKITKQGVVSTLAGNGQAGYQDGPGTAALFNGPMGVAVDKVGNIYVADTYNDRIRRIAKDGVVTTVAGGNMPGYRDGSAQEALFDTPTNLVIDSKGNIIVADTRNHAIRKITPLGEVSSIVASAKEDQTALMRRPVGLAITHDDYLYVGESSHGRLLQIAPTGEMRGLTGVDIDIIPGDDTSQRIQSPMGIAVNKSGSLVATDSSKTSLFQLHAKGDTKAHLRLPRVDLIVEPIVPPPRPHLWPVHPQDQVHEVVGTMGEVRGNYDGDARDHFHRGLDIQAPMGATVFAIEDEKVSSPVPAWGAGSINEGTRIHRLSYIHMKVGRDQKDQPLNSGKFVVVSGEKGKPEQVRIKRGTRFKVGDALGTINSMFHVHLNYTPEGDNINPFMLNLVGFEDHIAPKILGIRIADKNANLRNKQKSDKVLHLNRDLNEVSIILDAYDQADGNAERRRLGLYEVAYQILRLENSAAGTQIATQLSGFEKPHVSIQFYRLPTDDEAVKIIYAENSGDTVHGNASTRFLYNITNEIQHGHAITKYWQIKDLPAGDYLIRISAQDYAGNVANQGTELKIHLD